MGYMENTLPKEPQKDKRLTKSTKRKNFRPIAQRELYGNIFYPWYNGLNKQSKLKMAG